MEMSYLYYDSAQQSSILCKICSKLTIKNFVQDQSCPPDVFSVNFKQISHTVLVFSLLNFKTQPEETQTKSIGDNLYLMK